VFAAAFFAQGLLFEATLGAGVTVVASPAVLVLFALLESPGHAGAGAVAHFAGFGAVSRRLAFQRGRGLNCV